MNEDEIVWEKCARLFMLNSILVLDSYYCTTSLIIKNIIAHPNELKYEAIKTASNAFQTKILSVTGGLDFLFAVGFDLVTEEDSIKVLRFNRLRSNEQKLSTGLIWLENTVTACREFAKLKSVNPSDVEVACAECIIQVKLPTGQCVFGGFMRGDTLKDALNYTCCYFQKERYYSLINSVV